MSKHLELNVIPNISNFNQYNDLVNQITSIITNPLYIRLGSDESIRSKELAEYLTVLTRQQITHTRKLPDIMTNIMKEHPEFGLTKKIKTCGTVYLGLTIANSPPAKHRNPPLNPKEKNERRRVRNLEILKTIKDRMCEKCGWTDMQYQQLCNLGLLHVIRDDNAINIYCMSVVARGNIVKFLYDKISLLKREARYALIIKDDFEKSIHNDEILSINSNAAIYTNRLNSAQMTYYAGEKLNRAVNSYINTVDNLPIIEGVVYPDIQQLLDLSTWLKNNSTFKTRKDMAEKQDLFDNKEPANYVDEDDLYTYSEETTIVTRIY